MADVAMHEGEVPAAGVVDVDDRCGRGWEVKTAVQETAEESVEEDHCEVTVAEWASDAAGPTGRGAEYHR